jgi:hypothetical protein
MKEKQSRKESMKKKRSVKKKSTAKNIRFHKKEEAEKTKSSQYK